MDAIQKIYIALFGRPADPLGLDFFFERTNGGTNLSAIANLSGTEEYQSRFRGLTTTEIITEIYNQLFGRDPEDEGLAIFEAALASGRQSINTIAINIAQSARGDDLFQLNNKVAAANLFTASIDTPAEIEAYKGNAAAAEGRAFLATVTADPATVPSQAEVDAAVADIGNAGTGGGGGGGGGEEPVQFIDLVAGPTESVGGGGNDVFYGIVAQTGSTLDSGDEIDGRGGNDALIITASDVEAAIEPILTSVEVLVVSGADAAIELDLAGSDPVKRLNLSESADFELTLSGLDGLVDAFVFETKNALIDLRYTAEAVAGSSDTQNVTLNGAVDTVFQADGAENLNVFSSGSPVFIEDETNSVRFEGAHFETMRIFGAGAIEIGDTNVGLFDASEAGGEVSVRLNGGAQNATGGSGDDFFNFVSTFDMADRVNGGEGSDQLRVVGGNYSSANAAQPFNDRVTSVERLSFAGNGTTIDEDTLTNAEFEQIQFRTTGADVISNANSERSYEFGRQNAGNATINLGADVTSVNVALFSLPTDNGEIATLEIKAEQPDDETTLNLDSQGQFSGGVTNLIANLDLAAGSQVNISGDGDLEISAFEEETRINAADFTGDLIVGGSQYVEVSDFGGETFDSTAASDVYVQFTGGTQVAAGGSGNDGFDFGSTFDITDTIDGGAGSSDQLRVAGGDYSSAAAAAPFNTRVTGIELVIFTGASGTTLEGDTFTNTDITRLQFRTTGDDLIDNAGSARTYEFGRSNDGNATLNMRAGAETVNVALVSNPTDNGEIDTLTVRAAQPADAVTLNLVSNGVFNNGETNRIDTIDLASGSLVNLSGGGVLDIGGLMARANIDATGFTGDLVIKGSEAPSVNVTDDSLSGQDSIALGVGNHRIGFSSGLDSGLAVGDSQNGSLYVDVIAGFDAGVGGDVLEYIQTGDDRAAYQALEVATIEAENLRAAADIAAGAVEIDVWTSFSWGGQSYALYHRSFPGDPYTPPVDILVQLAGVDVTTLTADNFA